jgi:hypothetical protein
MTEIEQSGGVDAMALGCGLVAYLVLGDREGKRLREAEQENR